MISKNSQKGLTYRVTAVRKGKLKGCPVTRFAVLDVIHGLHGATITYWVSVFEDLVLSAGDSVRFIDIDNLTASYDPEKKKTNYFFNAVVEVVHGNQEENIEQKEGN